MLISYDWDQTTVTHLQIRPDGMTQTGTRNRVQTATIKSRARISIAENYTLSFYFLRLLEQTALNFIQLSCIYDVDCSTAVCTT